LDTYFLTRIMGQFTLLQNLLLLLLYIKSINYKGVWT
jgi:hypothetical protein